MPLFKVDVFEEYTSETLTKVLDIIHKNAVEAFEVPEGDRYQIVTRHAAGEMILKDTGLGFTRSRQVISIQIFSRPREQAMKVLFYKNVATELEQTIGLNPKDILISFFVNSDEDWSFADGEAQFLTGKL
jgi:hypothetical protein